MRKRFRVLIFAAIVAAVAVPVGFALSLDGRVQGGRHGIASDMSQPAVTSTVVLAPLQQPALSLPDLPDGPKLFLVGTVLFGLASALRRRTQ
jgi:hypothetical protein